MSRPFIPPSDYSDDESDRESQRIANAQRGRLWRSSPERVGGDNWGLFAKSPGGPALPPGGKGPQRGRPFAGETPGGLGRPRGGLNQSEPYSPIPSDYEESRSRHGVGDRPSDRDEPRARERGRPKGGEEGRGWGQGSPTGGRHDDGYESDGRPPDFGQRRPVRHDRREDPRQSGRPEAERSRRDDPNDLGRPDVGRNRPNDRHETSRPDVGRNPPGDRRELGRPGDPRDHRYSPNGRGYPPREREAPRSRERAPGPDDSYDGFRPPDRRNRRPSGQPRRYDPEDRWDERENGRYPPKDGAMPTRDYNPGQRRFTPKEQVPPNRRFTPQDQRNVRKNTPHDPRVPSDFEPDRIDRRRPGEPPGGRSQYDRDDVSWGPRFPTDGPYGRDEAPPSSGRSAPPVDRRGHDMPPSERRGQPMHSPPNPQGVVATGHRPDFPPTYYISPPRVPEGPHRPLAKNGPYPERENGYISDASSRYRPRDDSYQSDDENSRSSQNDGYEIPAKKPNRGFSYAPKESLERSFNQGSGLPFNPPTPRPGLLAPTSLETVSDEDRGHPEGQPSFAEVYRQKPTAYPEKSEDPTGDDVVFLSTTLAYWLIGVGVASLVVGTVGLFFCMTWQAMAGAPLWSGLCVIATGVLAIVNNKYPSKIFVVAFVVVAVVALILQLVNVGVTGSGISDAVILISVANGDSTQSSVDHVSQLRNETANSIFTEITSSVFENTDKLELYVNIAMFSVILLTAAVANVLLIFVLARAVWRLRQRQEKKGERNISMMNLPQAEHVEHPNPTHNQRHYMDPLT
ncbi:PREDICTED: serine/arginine repetitive matrix protein 1-like [Branchiostoma belcheri]|uniref:Serine/arginine repetitive matrix protein 1-like n=1 Tax=Branchiostoma belcheri TaxID=7741 RepID=A0A6P4YTY3_BRABE|nr:PREDICTED: serine/arginine repetitive matrix protein 1-like [Branchiostoma belcheri]